jgi:hypothetical protein
MRKYWYVGHTGGRFVAFRSAIVPTEQTHGARYVAVIGPFRTARGARWAAQYGENNPHFQTVADAERFAAKGE